MPRKDELVIRIRPDFTVVVEDTENGTVSCKEITPDSLLECIKASVKVGAVSSGVLPQGCVSYSKGDAGLKICVEYPSRRCDIRYEKTVYPDFPLPRLIFGFNIRDGGQISGVDLCVAGEGMLTPKTPLYVYPFSNVFEFRLCCGANRLPPVKSPHQLMGVMHFIMSMLRQWGDEFRAPCEVYFPVCCAKEPLGIRKVFRGTFSLPTKKYSPARSEGV